MAMSTEARERQIVVVKRLIKLLGGPTKTARAFAVHPQTVVFWRLGSSKFPAEHCPTAEDLSDGEILCEDLRPDIQWRVLVRRGKRKQ